MSTKSKKKSIANIASTDRLEELLEETERELDVLQPKIDKLEKQLDKLKELKLAKQKLITLKLSIKSILSNFSNAKVDTSLEAISTTLLSSNVKPMNFSESFSTSHAAKKTSALLKPSLELSTLPEGTFLPELAFNQVDTILRKKTSINYDLFRAIVFNGGRANTEEIRQYLVEHHIKQPASGEGFEAVELTDISSRVNYLVRKGVVKPDGRGTFISCLGWTDAEP